MRCMISPASPAADQQRDYLREEDDLGGAARMAFSGMSGEHGEENEAYPKDG